MPSRQKLVPIASLDLGAIPDNATRFAYFNHSDLDAAENANKRVRIHNPTRVVHLEVYVSANTYIAAESTTVALFRDGSVDNNAILTIAAGATGRRELSVNEVIANDLAEDIAWRIVTPNSAGARSITIERIVIWVEEQ